MKHIKNHFGFTVAELAIVIAFASTFIITGYVVYIMLHFITKFW
jgi:Tfp pilus assembly protein FimT